jgi:hypothetical protein
MPLRVKCVGCGQVLEAPDSLAGKKAKCQNCGAVVELPSGDPFVPPQELASPARQPASPAPPQAPASVVGSAPQRPPSQARVTVDRRAASIKVDHGHKTKSWFRTGVGITLICTAASAIVLVGGCIIAAIVAGGGAAEMEPMVEESAPDESTPSPGEMGVGTQIPVNQGFEFKNITTRRDFSIFKVLGEVINHSGRSYSNGTFVITVYDKDGHSLDSVPFNVSKLADGATRTFEIPFVGVWGDEIGRYKIEFKNGQ